MSQINFFYIKIIDLLFLNQKNYFVYGHQLLDEICLTMNSFDINNELQTCILELIMVVNQI